jgi:hypothetical protein
MTQQKLTAHDDHHETKVQGALFFPQMSTSQLFQIPKVSCHCLKGKALAKKKRKPCFLSKGLVVVIRG